MGRGGGIGEFRHFFSTVPSETGGHSEVSTMRPSNLQMFPASCCENQPIISPKWEESRHGKNGNSVIGSESVLLPEGFLEDRTNSADDVVTTLRAALVEHSKRLVMLEGQLKAALGNRRRHHHNKSREYSPSASDVVQVSSPSPFSRSASRNRDLEKAETDSGRTDSEVMSRNRSGEEWESERPHSSRSMGRHHRPSASISPGAGTPVTGGNMGFFIDGRAEPATSSVRRPRSKKIFDKDTLKAIYDKPYRQARRQGAMVGAGILGLMSMPFGPIGMVAGGLFGSIIGGSFGLWYDRRTVRRTLRESEAENRRLKSLVRWAIESFHEDDEFVDIIEMVTLEFKPIADIAAGSKHARKLLKLLDGWIANKKVTRHLWAYMDMLLKRWRDLNRADFMKSMKVFQTLTTMYRYSTRVLDEQEIEFLHRMERLLEHESVKLVIKHAEQNPSHDAARLMECMITVDALSGRNKRKTSVGNSPAGSRGGQSPIVNANDDEASDASEENDAPEFYQYTPTAMGLVMAPSDLDMKRTMSGHSITRQISNGPGTPLSVKSPRHAFPAKDDSDGRDQNLVLKKPFFKGWDDFLEFDCTFKHKMPITLSEFELLSQKNQETLKGWDVCVDRKEIKVAKVQVGVGCITLRAWATVPGVDLTVAFYLFFNINMRVKWDKVFVRMDLVDPSIQGSDIIYSLMKVPAVTPRDFLQYRRVRVMDDGSIHIVLRSAVHPDMPEQKGVIRAESYISGYILTQEYENGTPVLKIFLMTCVDIKGLIPKWLINATAPRKPAEWVETLRKAALDYQKEHPNYKQELLEELKPFRENHPYDYEASVVPYDVAGAATETARFGTDVDYNEGGNGRTML